MQKKRGKSKEKEEIGREKDRKGKENGKGNEKE